MISCMPPIINDLLKIFKTHFAVEIDPRFRRILYWKRLADEFGGLLCYA